MTARQGSIVALALACGVLGACENLERPGLHRDPIATAGALGGTARPEAGSGSVAAAPLGEAARKSRRAQAARGFIRRGAPQPLTPAGSRTATPLRGGEITLDFQGADLASVVQVMMEDGLGASYVMSPQVSGTVTLRTNRPLSQGEILPTLEEILRLNDAAVVDDGGVFRILPREEAGLAAPVVGFRDVTARGLTVRVTPLRHISVDDITEVMDSFAPVAGSIRYDRSRNIVFSTGTEAEQRTILNVISTLDVDFFAGRSFALHPLREASPQPVVEELEALFASPNGAPNRATRFLAIERIGAVMVIAEEQRHLDEALDLIRFLDQGVGETPKLHVYSVTNRRASDLASVLGNLFDAAVSGTATSSALAPGLTPVSTTTGGETGEDGDAGIGLGADATASPGAGLSATSGGAGQNGVIRIVADDSSNAIVALATSSGADELEDALRRLDVQPLQVQIEATLLEVALNDQLEFGVRYFVEQGNFSTGFTDPPSTVAASGLAGFFPGFNAAFNTPDINVTINALDSVTDVRLLSSPTLMVLDNQVARLQVGDQVPITIRSAQSTLDPDAPLVAETEFRDTGVILEIQPTVNAGGLVVLNIRQEVSDVIDVAGEENPTFAQRVVESTVAVQSGDTIALAGLIEENSTSARDGIPLLSDIPYLGAAFGTRSNAGARSELLIMIRPVVIRDQTDAQIATEELRRKLQAISTSDRPASILNGE